MIAPTPHIEAPRVIRQALGQKLFGAAPWEPGAIWLPGGIRIVPCPPGSGRGAPTETYIDPSLQDRTTVTITAVTTTASVAHTSHGYSNGDTVKIYGAAEADYNGHFVISNVATHSYDYTMGGSPSSPATGTIAASKNTGAGTSGDPYSDLQWAHDTITRDATNGDKFNVKAGTDEILATNPLDPTGYGSASATAPTIIRGYTTTADDGGKGGIDGNGGGVIGVNSDFCFLIDMHCHNAGSSNVLDLDFDAGAIACEIDNTSGRGVDLNRDSFGVFLSHIHDCGGIGIAITGTGMAGYNYLKNDGSNDFSEAIQMLVPGSVALGNMISIDGSSDGVGVHADRCHAIRNSVLSASGTGTGIETKFSQDESVILSNLVEGFIGAGGKGFDLSGATGLAMYGNNAAYNNTTNYSGSADTWYNNGDNEALGASPFDKSGSDTFANRHTYFAPADTGNVRGGAFPSGARLDKGAVQHADPAGATTIITRPRRQL